MAIHLFEEKKKQEDPNLSEKVLDDAHQRAEKIIERALQKSEEILKEMEDFRAEMESELRPIFRQSGDSFIHTITEQSKQFADACNALIPQIKEKYINDVDRSVEGFKIELSKELVPIREVVDKNVQEAAALLKTRIDEEWTLAQKEIQDYKTRRMQQINQQLGDQIETLAKEAFGKSLTTAQHQQLVMNALEKAKKEGVFNT
jgi:F0F1-type ATP synthase membrane subunit b/b'